MALESNENKLGFIVEADLSEFKKQLSEFDARLARMQQTTEQTTNNMSSMFGNLGKLFGAYVSFGMLENFTRQLINIRGEFQKLEIAFGTMLGSQEKANALMSQLTETAAKTPFDLQGIAQGAKQLLAYGTNAEDVNETLVRLGNIAAGLSLPLGDLVYLYGTTQVQGRLYAQDMRQFLGRGIPLTKELAKQFNVTEDAISAMVSEGKIGFPEVEKAIKAMTDEGGMFFNLMEKQSASLSGQISNLDDAIDMMFNEIGEASQDVLSKGISVASWAVENYKTLGKVVLNLAEIYGAYKTALAVNLVIEKSAVVSRLAHIKLIKLQTIAQTALNAVTKVNPYVAVATAVMGIATLVWNWKENTDAQKDAQERLNKKMAEADERIKTNEESIRSSIAVIQDKTASIIKQVEAYNQLQKAETSLNGKSMEEIQGMSVKQIDDIINGESREERRQTLNNELRKVDEKIAEAQRHIESLSASGAGMNNSTLNAIYSQERERNRLIAERAELNKRIVDMDKEDEQIRFASLTTEQKSAELQEKISLLSERRAVIEAKISELSDETIKSTMMGWETAMRSQQNALKDVDKELQDLQTRYDAVNGKQKDEVKNYLYWEQKRKEAMDQFHNSLPATKEYEKAKENIRIAEKEMEKWTLKAKQTSDAIKNLIEQWKELRKNSDQDTQLEGLSEFDRMRKEAEFDMTNKIDDLKKKKDDSLKQVGLTSEEKDFIVDTFNKEVERIKRGFETATRNIDDEERAYLVKLNNDFVSYYQTELENQISEIERTADDKIKDLELKFGKDSAEFADNKSDIEKKRDAQIEDATVNAKIQKEERALDIRIKQIEMTKSLLGEERAELEIMDAKEDSLVRQIRYLEEQKHGLTEEEQIKLDSLKLQLDQIRAQKDRINKELRDMRSLVEGMFGSIGSSLGKSDNDIVSSVGSLFSNIGSSMGTARSIQQAKADGDMAGAYGQAVSAAVSGTIDMANLLMSSVKRNREALEAWDSAVRESTYKMQNLELEDIGWKDTNIWGSANPMDKIQKSLEKASKAQQMASESLEKLGEGRVKVGTEKKIDAQTTLQATGIGVSIGTAIGSLFGPWGALIGAGAGAITGMVAGMIGGRKEVDVYDSLKNKYGKLYDKETLEINKQILADYDKMDDATKRLIDHTKELLESQKESMEEFEGYLAEMTGDVSSALANSLVDAFSDGNIYKAVDSFHDYVKQQIESIVSANVFNAVFGDVVDNLSETLKKTGDDMEYYTDISSTLASFSSQVGGLLGQYDTLMSAYQDAFAQGGYDLFRSQADVVQDALSGTIASMSEDTASKLNGNFMGLKLSAMEINQNVGTIRSLASEANELMARSLSAMNRIADNTAFCERLVRLDELADDISDIRRNGVNVR